MRKSTSWWVTLIVLLAVCFAGYGQVPAPQGTEFPANGACGVPGPVAVSPCTVRPGNLEIDTDFVDAGIDSSTGTPRYSYTFLNSFLKYGLTNKLDFEIAFAPWAMTNNGAAPRAYASGFTDMHLRLRISLFKSDLFSLAIAPDLKVPSAAAGLGNGLWESKVIIPIAAVLPGRLLLTVDPEIGILSDHDTGARHVLGSTLVGIGRSVGKGTIALVEVQFHYTFGARGMIQPMSVVGGLDWTPRRRPNFHVDIGADVVQRSPLNVTLYAGISVELFRPTVRPRKAKSLVAYPVEESKSCLDSPI